jgi:hypothetical protein
MLSPFLKPQRGAFAIDRESTNQRLPLFRMRHKPGPSKPSLQRETNAGTVRPTM